MKLLFIVVLILFFTNIYSQPVEQPTDEQVKLLNELCDSRQKEKIKIIMVLPLKHCPAYFLSISTFIDSVEHYLDASHHELIYIVPEIREIEFNYYFKDYLQADASSAIIIRDNQILDKVYADKKIFPFVHIRTTKNDTFSASFSNVLMYFNDEVLPLLTSIPSE